MILLWRKRVLVAAVALCLVAASGVSRAEELDSQAKPRWELSMRSWMFTNGETTWGHNASGSYPFLGNPTSKLTYKDNNTHILEFGAKFNISKRWFLRGEGGFSVALDRGSFVDQDYLAGQYLYLQTKSDISGSGTWYVNGDLGFRAVEFRNGRGYLDVFGGLQYWRTKYEATGLDVQVCDSGIVTPCPASHSGGLMITNTTQWITPLRIGIDTEYRFTRWFSVDGKVAVSPISVLYNEDRHEQRSDLQKPSFTMWGAGASVDADVGVKVMLTKNLALTGGYRVWWNVIYSGTMENHPVGYASQSFPLTEFQTLRHGPTVGLTASF
ncbi:hypothetical protein ACO9S2_12040 [Nitrospira sp. NS4]|uniref:hypothetical protein n=1 Tax=Nitrospira sp. NS4 TaxID=3414498 RepID=UPI003C2EB2DB